MNTAATRIVCFYCDRGLAFDAARITPYGKTSCADCYNDFHADAANA